MNNNSKSNTEKIKFICLPGGGTSSVVFYKWFGKLNEKYRPNFIDLPGRGLRKNEEPLTNIDDITNDLFNGLKKVVEDERNENYVLFAYCMGSIFLYELLKKIEKENFAYPIHIFLVAADVPYGEMYKTTFLDNPATKFQFYDLIRNCFPEHTFKDTATLKSFRETFVDVLYKKHLNAPNCIDVTFDDLESIIDDKELLSSFEFKECLKLANELMKILIIDCDICSDYQKKGGLISKIKCSITGISGDEDILYTKDTMKEWESYTDIGYKHFVVEGGHRIFFDPGDKSLSILNSEGF